MPILTITDPDNDTPSTHQCDSTPITIGRTEQCTITLDNRAISREHAHIIEDNNNYFISDLKSGNGTYLNGLKLDANDTYLIKNGDHIQIDIFDLYFYLSEQSMNHHISEEITGNDILEVKLLKKVLGSLEKDSCPSVEVLNGKFAGQKFCFNDDMQEIIIGRDPDNTFTVNEHVISRNHVRISRSWGAINIRDLDSKNGTFINNRRIVEETLHDGDRIALGTIIFIYRNPIELQQIDFGFEAPKKLPHIDPKDIQGLPQDEHSDDTTNHSNENNDSEDSDKASNLDSHENSTDAAESYPTPQTRSKKSLMPGEMIAIIMALVILVLASIIIIYLLQS